MLRMLCNENVPRSLVLASRRLGHDVDRIVEAMAGASDEDVLRAASVQARVCVTFDKDFGELAARTPAAAVAGIILLRLPTWPAEESAKRIAAQIDARRDWAGHFSVLETGRPRMRPIVR